MQQVARDSTKVSVCGRKKKPEQKQDFGRCRFAAKGKPVKKKRKHVD